MKLSVVQSVRGGHGYLGKTCRGIWEMSLDNCVPSTAFIPLQTESCGLVVSAPAIDPALPRRGPGYRRDAGRRMVSVVPLP